MIETENKIEKDILSIDFHMPEISDEEMKEGWKRILKRLNQR